MPNNYNMGANAWSGWEVQVLTDLGAPTSKLNIAFLDEWQAYEHSTAKNNPLNLTAPKGIASINSDNVQSYATQQEGAMFTANNIRSGMYPTIYKMLKTDSVKNTLLGESSIGALHLSSLQDLVTELRKWGSGTFADKLSGGTSAIDKTTEAVQAPFKDWNSFISWMGTNWDRVLFVLGGVILIIIALIFVAKTQATKATFSFARGDE